MCLDATQFREQLRRNMNIILTDEELGALVYLFDKNGDGFIDTAEFKNEFFRLGKQDREKFNYHKAQEKERHQQRLARLEAKQKEYLERFSRTNVAETWTEEQQASAIKKIANVAFTYDGFKGGLEGFANTTSLTPAEFKEIMRRKFETFLTPEETGALCDMFDRNDNGMIDTREFVYQFFKIGRREREFHFNNQKQKTLANQEAERERIAAMKDRYGKLVEARMTPSTEEDRQSVLDKITHAATHFKSESVFSSNLWKSFESADLTPTAFKELLKSTFDIYLSPGELDAMVKLFDTDNSGSISCVEFMTTFFRIGLRERSRLVAEKRYIQERLARAEAIRKQARIERQKMQTLTSVIWPVLPNEDEEDAIALPAGKIKVQDLAHMISTGPGEVCTYIMQKHLMNVSPQDLLEPSLARDVVVGHGKKLADNSGASPQASPLRSVAPMIPTEKVGRHNAFLQKRPTLQSAIGRTKGSSKGAGKSMADLFPKASKDTKDFIRKLEDEEKRVHSQGKKKSKKGSKNGSVSASRQESFMDLGEAGGNLDDWNFSQSNVKANIQMGQDEDWDAMRPTTSANSQRAGSSKDTRGGRVSPLQGTSIVEEEY